MSSETEHELSSSVPQIQLQCASTHPEKPTQVVTPAVNRSQAGAGKSKAAALPSPALAGLERILALAGEPPAPRLPPPANMDPRLLEQLQAVKEHLAAQEEEARRVADANRRLQDQLRESDDQIKKLVEQNDEYSEKEKSLGKRMAEKLRNNKQMTVIMEEYERTISSLIGEREAERRAWAEEREALRRERDEAAAHLASMEHSFNDVHAKYERCKAVIHGYKANEEARNRALAEHEETIAKMEARYETLRQHAMQQLGKANRELDAIRKAHQLEATKLNAMLKKSEIHAASLQESLAQKIKDNEELTAICDELINKVG